VHSVGQMPNLMQLRQPLGRTEGLVHSAVSFTYVVPWTKTQIGDKSFAAAGPRVWNFLPASLQAVDACQHFKRLLKTHWFIWACGA